MLTRVMIGDVKLLCSAATEAEIREMYAEVLERHGVEPSGAREVDEPRTLFFQYECVGPVDVIYRDRRFVLFGSPKELRFYTPEEYKVLTEE